MWGGKSWQRIGKFVHANVQQVDYSHDESYLVTWSPLFAGSSEDNLRVWDLKTGKLLRAFQTQLPETEWPLFKFAHSSRFAALRQDKDTINIYDLPEMTLTGGKPLMVEGVVEFAW